MKQRRSLRAVKTTFDGAICDEVRYWLSRSMVERISAVELIRKATFGIYREGGPSRLERVATRMVAPWAPK